jgi:hypothetical protein
MIIWLLLFSMQVFAAGPTHWSYLLEISDKHEFYQNNEIILKPKDSWQSLFGLVYLDRNLQQLKDCVFYRVPGVDEGILKIKTISAQKQCEDYLLLPGDREVSQIKSLQFILTSDEFSLDISFNDFRNEKWEGKFQGSYVRPQAQMNLSSAEFKSPKMIFLAPVSPRTVSLKKDFLKENSLCHDINEDCQENQPHICDQCPGGWYEIPNSCGKGPKFCGTHKCGLKDRPACRRGMTWQKSTDDFDCRKNPNFAYCAKGLSIYCEGQKAFCR